MIRRDESGYSIVEVMVAILILMAAILPMFKMFDVSLQTAMRSSDYDRARALAEKQTEIAQSVEFTTLENNGAEGFPRSSAGIESGLCEPITDPDALEVTIFEDCQDKTPDTFDDLRFSVEKSFVSYNPDSTTIELTDSPDDTELVKIVIKIYKDGENPDNHIFKTVGVIANEDGDG